MSDYRCEDCTHFRHRVDEDRMGDCLEGMMRGTIGHAVPCNPKGGACEAFETTGGAMRIEEHGHVFLVEPLSQTVLAVASLNVSVGDWSAYIDSVPGENHRNEWQAVSAGGAKMRHSMAEALFGTQVYLEGQKRPSKDDDPRYGGPYRWRD